MFESKISNMYKKSLILCIHQDTRVQQKTTKKGRQKGSLGTGLVTATMKNK